MYFNTTQKKGFDLLIANEKTERIKDRVLILLKLFGQDNTHPGLTASQVHELNLRAFNKMNQIWSIRPRLTELVEEGVIIKTNKKKLGPYGEPEHYYKLR